MIVLLAERVVFLSEVGDSDGDYGYEHFRWGRVDAAEVYEELETEIVDEKIEGYDGTVAEELFAAF